MRYAILVTQSTLCRFHPTLCCSMGLGFRKLAKENAGILSTAGAVHDNVL